MVRGEQDYHRRAAVSSYPVMSRLIYPTVVSLLNSRGDDFSKALGDEWGQSGTVSVSGGKVLLSRAGGASAGSSNIQTMEHFAYGMIRIVVQFGTSPATGAGEGFGFAGPTWLHSVSIYISDTNFRFRTRRDGSITDTDVAWSDDYKNNLTTFYLVWRPGEAKLLNASFTVLATNTTNVPDVPVRVIVYNSDELATTTQLSCDDIIIYPVQPEDVVDRAGRLLGVVYGSRDQKIQQRASTYELLVQLQKAGVDIDPRDRNWLLTATDVISAVQSGTWTTARSWNLGGSDVPNLSDRAARLLGVIYGDQGQLAQRTTTKEALIDLIRIGGTAQTGRDVAADYATLVKLHPKDALKDRIVNLNLVAGASNNYGTAVPTGELWKVTTISIWYTGTVAGVNLYMNLYDGTTQFTIWGRMDDPVNDVPYTWTGEVWMKAGDKLNAYVEGATLNDNIYMDCFGVKYNA